MKYLINYKVFEKSSLTYLGIPNKVMVDIQKLFAISDDAKWQNLPYKKDIRTQLRGGNNNLFITILKDNILVIFSNNNKYYVDNYSYYSQDDFGDDNYWEKEDRIETTITKINNLINRSSKIYKLVSGDWSYKNRAKRRIEKGTKEFENYTNQFKKDFAGNFTRIIKKIYSKRSNLIQDMIITNLINVNINISPNKAKEILTANIDKAKQSEFYKKKGYEKDPFKLQLQYIKDNSLTIFNEFLIRFEDEISKKHNEYLNLPEICNRFTRDRVMTMFMYFLYSGKLMN